jgi:fatty-acyl-CoA synthase
MLGMMQEWPLLCHKVIDHAAIYHGQREVVSRSVEGPFHRTNYAEIRARSLKLAQRLERDGCGVGDRIATMAWNTWRHLETWYGILGIGAVYHTLNPRLFPDQIAWIMNDAEDKMLFVDLTFVKLVEMIAPKVPEPRTRGDPDRRCTYARDLAEECGVLRKLYRGSRRRFHMGGVRRTDGGRDVLHVRHHG